MEMTSACPDPGQPLVDQTCAPDLGQPLREMRPELLLLGETAEMRFSHQTVFWFCFYFLAGFLGRVAFSSHELLSLLPARILETKQTRLLGCPGVHYPDAS